MSFSKKISTWYSAAPRGIFWSVVIIIIAVGGIAAHYILKPSGGVAVSSALNETHVRLINVSQLAASANTLTLVGTVTSHKRATVRTQVPGEVVVLKHSLGDTVASGALIAELANSAQRAALVQAHAAYTAAQVELQNAQGTSATSSAIATSQARTGVKSASAALATSLQGTYAAISDAVYTRADRLFSNPGTIAQRLTFTVPDARLVSLLREERLAFKVSLPSSSNTTQATPESLHTQSAALIASSQQAIQFLGNLITAVNETVPGKETTASTLVAYAASVSAGRGEVINALSALIAVRGAYDNVRAALDAAQNIATGGISNAIALARAHVEQAGGAYQAAQSAYNQTLIHSPLTGVIVSLPISLGDYLTAFTPIAIVSNPRALYIKTYVSAKEAKTLAVGDAAAISGSVSGKIDFIAPALNPLTNTIEVHINIGSKAVALTDGEAVTIAISRPTQPSSSTTASSTFPIPLTAVKLTPAGAEVFTVKDATHTLVARPVSIKNVFGNTVVVNNIAPDTLIVKDVRGLSRGQTVVVDAQ